MPHTRGPANLLKYAETNMPMTLKRTAWVIGRMKNAFSRLIMQSPVVESARLATVNAHALHCGNTSNAKLLTANLPLPGGCDGLRPFHLLGSAV